MAFPSDLEIEMAFNNDIDETNYAQTGWTSILPFVSSFDGDLRGREYELGRAEAGTLSVVLDNGDGRFIPGSVRSPYFPFVKSDRRFRIRGKNMVHPNIARGGSRDHALTGVITNVPQPSGSPGTGTYTVTTKPISQKVSITVSAEPDPTVRGKGNLEDGNSLTKWFANTSTGSIIYQYPAQLRMTSYSVTSGDDAPTRDPKNWTIQGSNDGSSYTTIHTVTGETFANRQQVNTYTITSPNFYLYYKMNITLNNGAVNELQVADLLFTYDANVDTTWGRDITHYLEVTKPVSQVLVNQYHRTIAWYAPVEYGVRLAQSAYVWRVAGTEPTSTIVKLETLYFDRNWVEVTTSATPNVQLSTLPVTNIPTQIGMSHTPPAGAKYGVVALSIKVGGTTNLTDLVYGVTAVQTELPTNLAPDIGGFRDLFNWQVEGLGSVALVGSDPLTSYVEMTWDAADKNLNTMIPHLIPGEVYSATVEAQLVGSQPSVLLSGDEGQTGTLVSSTSWNTISMTFTANTTEQQIQFIPQTTPTAAIGLRVRKLNVVRGSVAPALATSAIDSGVTAWARPKDLFEGWVESFPVQAGSIEVTVTVVDRMKRLGEVSLENTLREALMQDEPVLLMPLADSMLDTPGRFSQLGSWGDLEGGPSYVDMGFSRGDLGVSTYTTTTDDGPTGEASLLLTPASISSGYFLTIPYTKDYTSNPTPVYTPPPVVATQPQSKPPPPPQYTYTKKWYATWSRSYDSTNATRFDDTPYMYQGDYPGSGNGNQRSLAGFDYRNIQSTLYGATILEVYVTVENEHARWNKGLDAELGSHNYSSKPSTWSGGTVRERRWRKHVDEGGAVTINVGVTFGNELKAGTSKGIALGPEAVNDPDHYGFFRGATQSGKPYITIKYRK